MNNFLFFIHDVWVRELESKQILVDRVRSRIFAAPQISDKERKTKRGKEWNNERTKGRMESEFLLFSPHFHSKRGTIFFRLGLTLHLPIKNTRLPRVCNTYTLLLFIHPFEIQPHNARSLNNYRHKGWGLQPSPTPLSVYSFAPRDKRFLCPLASPFDVHVVYVQLEGEAGGFDKWSVIYSAGAAEKTKIAAPEGLIMGFGRKGCNDFEKKNDQLVRLKLKIS